MKQIDIQFKTFRFKGDNQTYFCPQAKVDYHLNVLGFYYIPIINNVLPSSYMDKSTWRHCPKERFKDVVTSSYSGLAGPYTPAAEMPGGFSLKVDTPDSMDESMAYALKQLKQAVGNVAEFVAERLQFSIAELADCLSLEQIDAVALAIYNVEKRNQGLIVGDQTGIGKGRIAASFVRYGILHGYKPVFFTEKPALFSDIMRDLNDIHSGHFVPFIINATGGDILDDEGYVAQYIDKETGKIMSMKHQDDPYQYALNTGEVPDGFDFVCCTYSQFSTADVLGLAKQLKKDDELMTEEEAEADEFKTETKEDKESKKDKSAKLRLMANICKGNIVVLDEAHNSGGEVEITKSGVKGNIGMVFQTLILPYCKGVLYLSATYAKFPKNMPVYAINTCISDIAKGIGKEDLAGKDPISIVSSLSSVQNYFCSIPAQEIISSNLCKFGQFIRRERTTAGMLVKYHTLDEDGHLADPSIPDLKDKHFDVYNNITEILQEMREYQEDYFTPYLKAVAQTLAARGQRGKKPPSVSSASLSSALFHLTNNILLSLKAEAIAERAIYHIENGKAVVIALADTNEAYLNKEEKKKASGEIDSADQIVISEGQRIKADYSFIFDKIFKNLFKYYVRRKGSYDRYDITIDDLESVTSGARDAYERILKKFETTTTGLCLSPIDAITDIIERRGYKVAECTGRGKYLKFDNETHLTATVEAMSTANGKRYSSQQGRHVSMCYNKFNNNEVDVLIINQSGSTGKSAHATNKNTKLREDQVKQRVMIVAQAELDVNTEVQKRGRINRTGQIASLPPLYEYITSGLPAEKRFMMMLKNKLKSLDANTTANQKQSNDSVLKVSEGEDFFNKYGDNIMEGILAENLQLNHILNDPLAVEPDPVNPKRIKQPVSELAKTCFGRMQILSPYDQQKYLNIMSAKYIAKKQELIKQDEWDLEIKELDYQAEFISEAPHRVSSETSGKHSELKGSSFMTLYSVKSQAKYTSRKDLEAKIKENIANGNDKTEWLLDKAKLDLDSQINAINQFAKQKVEERDAENEERLAKMVDRLQQYIDNEMPKDRIDTQKKAIEEFKEKIAEEKGKIDPSYEERKEKFRERYNVLKKMLPLLKVGSVYKTDTCIYVIVSVITTEDAFDSLSKPSAILVSMITTNEYEQEVSKNLADTGMEWLKELVKNKSSMDEYNAFVSDDSKREKKYVITGNIVPLIGNGTVISRFSMKDGSYQNGIVVKPQIINGEATIPPEYRYVHVPIGAAIMGAVKRTLFTNNSTMSFESAIGHGKFDLTGMRMGDRIKVRLEAEMNYGEFLKKDELLRCYEDKYSGLEKSGGYWTGYIDDVDRFLDILAEYHFMTQVSLEAAEKYKDAINTERYKTKDWEKLSYDKKKIPTDYIGKLLLREFETIFKQRELSGKTKKQTKNKTKK